LGERPGWLQGGPGRCLFTALQRLSCSLHCSPLACTASAQPQRQRHCTSLSCNTTASAAAGRRLSMKTSWAAQMRRRCRRPRYGSAQRRTRLSTVMQLARRACTQRPPGQPRARPRVQFGTSSSLTWTPASGSWRGSTLCSTMPSTPPPYHTLVRAGCGLAG
jgi:hypothetical protein